MTEFSDTPSAARPAGSGDDATGELPPQPPVTDAPPPPPPPPPVTDAPPSPQPPPPQGAFAARYGLIRPRSGRYLAGVSGALARATNTDPVLWRVLFVVLAFFGGFGVLAYLVLWLGTPAEGDTASPVEAVFGRGRSSTSATLTVIAGVITLLILFGTSDNGWPGGVWPLVILAVIGVAVYYSTSNRRSTPPAPTVYEPPAGTVTTPPPPGYQPAFAPHGPYATAPPAPPRPAVKPPKPPKERSRLGGLIMSVVLLVLGVMGLLDLAGNVDIPVAAYFAAALAVIGGGLVLGAVLGRARGMIFVGLALILALSVSSVGDRMDWKNAPADGGGDIAWTPQQFSELQPRYDHQAGSATLDLTRLDFAGHDTSVALSIQAGDLQVIVPPNVDVTTDADVRLGSATVFDRNANGVRINNFQVTDLGADGEGGGKLHLDIRVSLGNAEVNR
jgi:phage shock protein PspC (stress-responsive transcriptional regulator)